MKIQDQLIFCLLLILDHFLPPSVSESTVCGDGTLDRFMVFGNKDADACYMFINAQEVKILRMHVLNDSQGNNNPDVVKDKDHALKMCQHANRLSEFSLEQVPRKKDLEVFKRVMQANDVTLKLPTPTNNEELTWIINHTFFRSPGDHQVFLGLTKNDASFSQFIPRTENKAKEYLKLEDGNCAYLINEGADKGVYYTNCEAPYRPGGAHHGSRAVLCQFQYPPSCEYDNITMCIMDLVKVKCTYNYTYVVTKEKHRLGTCPPTSRSAQGSCTNQQTGLPFPMCIEPCTWGEWEQLDKNCQRCQKTTFRRRMVHPGVMGKECNPKDQWKDDYCPPCSATKIYPTMAIILAMVITFI